jgi:hypothetical protein
MEKNAYLKQYEDASEKESKGFDTFLYKNAST